jgi:phytoene/squalene synthetase
MPSKNTMTNPPPGDSAQQCREMAHANERDRWLGTQLAPAHLRGHLAALLAYYGEVARTRAVVSEPMLGQIRLQWWREAVEKAATGTPRAHPVAEALVPLLATGRVTVEALTALADAREADLDDDGFARRDDFFAYLDATSGALNLLMLDVLGEGRDAAAREAARRIGRAYGLIGHLRAAAVIASRGRVVLPRDLLQKHGTSPADLLSGQPGPALRDAARELGFMAAGELAGARALAQDIRRAALPVLVLARFCDAYLARLQRAEWDVFAAGIEPLPVTIPLLLIRARISGRF